ncbi:MAG: manganese efflux pump MntP family protein [Dehalococcoidales bacterium]
MSGLEGLSVLVIALGLSADCFAVTLSGSITMRTVSLIQTLRTAFTFGLFQALMPVLGWLAGRTVVDLIGGYDHWVAFTLLSLIGARMIWQSLRGEEAAKQVDITRGLTLITLAVATSIDALAVGLTFAFLDVNIVSAALIIGAVAFIISVFGFFLGKRAGRLLGRRAEAFGGIILIAIGLRILLTHIIQ